MAALYVCDKCAGTVMHRATLGRNRSSCIERHHADVSNSRRAAPWRRKRYVGFWIRERCGFVLRRAKFLDGRNGHIWREGTDMRVTSGSWDGEKVILRDQVLEVRPSSTPGCRGPRGRTSRTSGTRRSSVTNVWKHGEVQRA
jgi:hypothetical protein